ncbi:hypothetical protein ACF0H5_005463 [Mactra antiquata]
MGYKDKLSIVSFNSQRKGLQSLSGTDRPSYYRELFENVQPDVCFLPGDDEYKSMVAVTGYKQYLKPESDDTVLLYDSNTVEMKQPQLSLETLTGDLPLLDVQQLVVPDVTVSSLEPYTRVVKEFNLISWRFDYLQRFNSFDGSQNRAVQSLVTFSQRLSDITRKPVLIGGELNMSFSELENIVKELSKNGHQEYLDGVQPFTSAMGYTRPISNTALRDQRHLFMMDVIKCSHSGLNGIVKTWDSTMVADCFIASKQLQLAEAKLVDIEKVIGRKVCVPLTTYRPTQTHIDIPVRPPRHHGG